MAGITTFPFKLSHCPLFSTSDSKLFGLPLSNPYSIKFDPSSLSSTSLPYVTARYYGGGGGASPRSPNDPRSRTSSDSDDDDKALDLSTLLLPPPPLSLSLSLMRPFEFLHYDFFGF